MRAREETSVARPPIKRPPRPPRHPVIVRSNVASLQPRYTLPAIAGSVSEAVFSPDGSLIALATGDDVHIHYAVNGAIAGQFKVGWQQALSLAFHPDGRHLAVGGHNGSSLTVWLYAASSPGREPSTALCAPLPTATGWLPRAARAALAFTGTTSMPNSNSSPAHRRRAIRSPHFASMAPRTTWSTPGVPRPRVLPR